MRLRVARSAVGLLVVAFSSVAWPPRAAPLEKEGLSVSRSDPVDERDYTPIPASAGGFFIDPPSCRTDTTCDTIPIELDATGFDEPEKMFLQLLFTLSWQSEEAEGTNVPDLDMYIYDKSEETEVGQGASSAQPEVSGVEWKGRDKTTLYVVVVNFAGGPTSYHLKLEAQGLEIKDIPKFARPTPQPLPPRPTLAPLVEATPPPAPSEPRATLRPVVTPGPDGPLTEVDLEAIDARAAKGGGGAPWWVVLASVVGSVGVLGGTGFLIFRRVRPRRA